MTVSRAIAGAAVAVSLGTTVGAAADGTALGWFAAAPPPPDDVWPEAPAIVSRTIPTTSTSVTRPNSSAPTGNRVRAAMTSRDGSMTASDPDRQAERGDRRGDAAHPGRRAADAVEDR